MSFHHRNGDDNTESAATSLEQQAQAHRRDIQKREDLLLQIRSKPGLESFLLPEKFSVLSKACQGHIAILLTIAGEHCDALIISPSRSISHLSLANVTQDDIHDLQTQWDASRNARLSNRGDERFVPCHASNSLSTPLDSLPETRFVGRGEGPASPDMDPMTLMLSDLWEKIVHPIFEKVEDTASLKLILCPECDSYRAATDI